MTRTALALAFGAWAICPSPGAAQAHTEGLFLGGHLHSAALSVDNGSELDSGAGIAAIVGYGFTGSLAAYAGLAGAYMQPPVDDSYGLGHFDLGLRLSLNPGGRAWVPYANGAFSGRLATVDAAGADRRVTGTGITLGGGLQYFFNSTVAVDVALNYGFGHLIEAEAGGESPIIDLGTTTTRLNLGITWYPGGS